VSIARVVSNLVADLRGIDLVGFELLGGASGVDLRLPSPKTHSARHWTAPGFPGDLTNRTAKRRSGACGISAREDQGNDLDVELLRL